MSITRRGHGGDIRFTRRSITLFAVSCALLFVAGAAAVILAYRAADAEGWVAHTIAVRELARETMNSALNAETGVRGFLLTDDRAFLEPYQSALTRLTTAPVAPATKILIAISIVATQVR